MSSFNWKTAKILVTGGHGFLGSHLVKGIKEKGCESITAPTHAECDFRDQVAVRTLARQSSYDVVFHLAASVGGIGANRERPADFFYDNALMGLNLFHELARAGVGRLVLLGTICAYPKFAPLPFREESMWEGYPEETNAPYGVAKRALLVGAEAYRKQYDLRYVAVFPTNLYGPGDTFDLRTSHVIPALIRKCEEARLRGDSEIVLWGTGKPTRDFLYVKDAVNGLLLAAEKEEALGQTLNLGSEREVGIAELADLIVRGTGYAGQIKWDSSQPDGQPRRCVSNRRARDLLGFVPKMSLEKGIADTIKWYRAQVGK